MTPLRDERTQLIEKLVNSSVLHGSESLCNLLRYLAKHSIDHPGTPLKEYQIATEVFRRPPDFDPRLDSCVRVQTGRLRSKLAEYYSGSGASDPVWVEIPKGSYTLTFRPRPVSETKPAGPLEQAAVHLQILPAPRRIRWKIASVFAASVILAFTAGGLILPLARGRAVPGVAVPEPLTTFWSAFISGPEDPLVIYSNAAFVGRPETGLRYFDSAVDRNSSVLDHYTGVGEVMAIHELDRLFTLLNRNVRVKRSRLMTWDEAKTTNLIFIGSPSENTSVKQLPIGRNFFFKQVEREGHRIDLAIVNRSPQPGEDATYFASDNLPITEDYALVSLGPGLSPSQSILTLAGTTTLGTQAAVEFVCRSSQVKKLEDRLNRHGSTLTPFEAVLRVKINEGVPVQSEIQAFRVAAP